MPLEHQRHPSDLDQRLKSQLSLGPQMLYFSNCDQQSKVCLHLYTSSPSLGEEESGLQSILWDLPIALFYTCGSQSMLYHWGDISFPIHQALVLCHHLGLVEVLEADWEVRISGHAAPFASAGFHSVSATVGYSQAAVQWGPAMLLFWCCGPHNRHVLADPPFSPNQMVAEGGVSTELF